MTEPMELPVITPGVEEATRKMRDFHGAVVESSQSARQHVTAQQEVGHGLQETAKHTESMTTKMRELGGELRHTLPEAGHLLKAMASEFLPILIAAEAVKMGVESVFEDMAEKAKRAGEEVRGFAKAMDEAQKSVDEAGEKKDKKDIAYAMKNRDVIGGLTAMGGDAAVGFAKGLAKDTQMPIEEVNKAVLSGKHAGMSDAEIRSAVQGAALGEKLGQGKFGDLASKASGLSHQATGRDFFKGDDAESLQNLLNAEGLEKWNSPEESAKRWERFQDMRKMFHDEDRAKGITPHNFRPVPQERFDFRKGTRAANLRDQSGRQAGTVSDDIDAVAGMHAAETVTGQDSSIGNIDRGGAVLLPGNARPAAEKEERKQSMEERFPGFTDRAHAYNSAAAKSFAELNASDAENKARLNGTEWGWEGKAHVRARREANDEADNIARSSSEKFGMSEGIFVQMAATLKAMETHLRSVDTKTKAPNQETAPK